MTHIKRRRGAWSCRPDPKFKTVRLSVNLLVPLREETAASYGILPGIVSKATKAYPDALSFSRHLSGLYGAQVGSGVRKFGGFQCLSLYAGGIANRYAFGGEDLFGELHSLLQEMVSHPIRDGEGLFPQKFFELERRQILESKDAEYNDKIFYAHRRCEELLLGDTAGAVERYGSREAVLSLDRAALSAAWEELLATARFENFALGDCSPEMDGMEQPLSALGSDLPLDLLPFEKPTEVRRREEAQPLSQSRLSLGLRVDALPDEKLLFQLMNAVLGGTPSSKLFRNVREKLSLCYDCSSSYSHLSRALYIESGVETENLDRAQEAILEELAALRRGEITPAELEAAKLSLCNAFKSVGDSLGAQESWELAQVFPGGGITPEQAAAKVTSYTADQVAEAAGRLHLGAVYRLRGKQHGEAM